MLQINLKNKKGQTWFVDMMIGIVIFIFMLILFYSTETNLKDESSEIISDLKFEGDMVTNLLMSPGQPNRWDYTNYTQLGIIENYKIDLKKIGNLSILNYSTVKSNLGTKYDFYFYFKDKQRIRNIFNNGTHVKEGYGYSGINSSNVQDVADPSHLIVIKRYVAYKNNIGTLVFYLWAK